MEERISFVEHIADVVLRRRLALTRLVDRFGPVGEGRFPEEAYQTLVFLSRLSANRSALMNIHRLGVARRMEIGDAALDAADEREGVDIVYLMDFSECHNSMHRDNVDAEPEGYVINALLSDRFRRHRIILSPATMEEITNYLDAMADRLASHDPDSSDTSFAGHGSVGTLLSRRAYDRLDGALGTFRASMAKVFSQYTDDEAAVFDSELQGRFLAIRDITFNHLGAVRVRSRFSNAVDAWNIAKVCELNQTLSTPRGPKRLYRLITRAQVLETLRGNRTLDSQVRPSDVGISPRYGCSSPTAFYHAETHGQPDAEPSSAAIGPLAETMDYLRRTSAALLDIRDFHLRGVTPKRDDVDEMCAYEVDPSTRWLARQFRRAVEKGNKELEDDGSVELSSEACTWLSVRFHLWARLLAKELEERLIAGRMTRLDRRSWQARNWLYSVNEPTALATSF